MKSETLSSNCYCNIWKKINFLYAINDAINAGAIKFNIHYSTKSRLWKQAKTSEVNDDVKDFHSHFLFYICVALI